MAGYRSLCARWLGGAGSRPHVIQPGYRSMLAYWLGGASSITTVTPIPPKPPEPAGGGGKVWQGYEKRPRRKINDDDEVALLVATAWVTIWEP